MGVYKYLGRCCAPFPQRYVVGSAVMGAMCIMFLQRICFNLVLTQMTFRLNITEEHVSQVCNITGSETKKTIENGNAEFAWSKGEQALLLGIFYVGYFLTHLPGGVLSDVYGPKHVLGFGMLISGVLTLLTPMCARINLYLLAFLRLVMGLSHGPLFPSQSTFVARWSFPHERSLMNSYMNIGSVLGAVVGQLCTGFLIHYLNKWDVVFYIYGAATFPCYLFWVFFVYNRVSSHPFVSENERRRLNYALEKELVDRVELHYGKIFTSCPVWAMVVAGFGHDWAFYIIISLLPHYMSYVMLFDIRENGALLCLPQLCMLVMQIISPYIANFLIERRSMSKTMQYKLFFLFCNQGPAVCFLAVTFAKCNRPLVVALFSLAMGLLGMIYSCVRVVQVDLAPNVAGFLMAVMNGVGGIAGFIVPEIFALFTKSNTVEGWRNAFIFSSILISATTIVFLVWGTSEVQDWNFPIVSNLYQANEEGADEEN